MIIITKFLANINEKRNNLYNKGLINKKNLIYIYIYISVYIDSLRGPSSRSELFIVP